jgi:hypothetical protein
MAGRKVGYAQLVLALGGLGFSLIAMVPCLIWFLKNRARLTQPMDDPFVGLIEILRHVRLPVLGLAIFVFGFLWGLSTGAAIVREARQAEDASAPPFLKQN